jgi:hypothetical protein
MLFIAIFVEAVIIYWAAYRAHSDGLSLYACLGMAAAEVVTSMFGPLAFLAAPSALVAFVANHILSLAVLLVLMLLFLEGGLGQKLYAWGLASLGIILWKLLYGLLMRYFTQRITEAVLLYPLVMK